MAGKSEITLAIDPKQADAGLFRTVNTTLQVRKVTGGQGLYRFAARPDANWIRFDPQGSRLDDQAESPTSINVTLTPPLSVALRPGEYRYDLSATADSDPTDTASETFTLTVDITNLVFLAIALVVLALVALAVIAGLPR